VKRGVCESGRKGGARKVREKAGMFVVEVGSTLTSLVFVRDLVLRPPGAPPLGFTLGVSLWLWFTVLFANLAEAVAEGRGKAQAESLRKAHKDTIARRLKNGREESVPAPQLQKGDFVVCQAGDTIRGDSDVIDGVASGDESA